MKTLIAIDGNSLMHRAYYALPSMAAKDGTPTGAIFGFLRMLLKLLERQPDYLVVAFDMKGPTFRHGEYGEYKAGRPAYPAGSWPPVSSAAASIGGHGHRHMPMRRL